MKLQRLKRNGMALLMLGLGGLLSACGHGGSSEDPAATASTADFTSYVSQLVQQTDASAEPQEINNRSFSFEGADDEHAYDALF